MSRNQRNLDRQGQRLAARRKQRLGIGIVCVVLVAAGAGLYVLTKQVTESADGGPGVTGGGEAAMNVANPPTQDELQEVIENAGRNAYQTPAQEALDIIADYRAKVDANPDSPDTPALIAAMGNTYQQKLKQYEEAAQCYESLLQDYPEWDGIANIYVQLASCYQKQKNTEYEQWTYRRMMENFDETTKEYEYAKYKLGL